MEKDWQGLPPTSRSGFPFLFAKFLQSTFVMSPRFGTSGYLSASTADGNWSISQNAIGSHPRQSQATDAASMPENVLTYLIYRSFRAGNPC